MYRRASKRHRDKERATRNGILRLNLATEPGISRNIEMKLLHLYNTFYPTSAIRTDFICINFFTFSHRGWSVI